MSEHETWTQPPQASSPVETLTEELYARFAETIGLDQDALTAELEGDLTPTTLRRLAAVTGLSPAFWTGLNRRWNERKREPASTNEQLRARLTVDDAMVERAAREIYRPERWDEVRHSAFMKPGEIRAILEGPRTRARRVLDAALNPEGS